MRDRFVVAPGVTVPVSELTWRYAPSGGPGGQHANRSATRAAATFDLAGCDLLDVPLRERLVRRLGAKLTVVVDDTRSQLRNRELAVERLEARLAAAQAPRRRRRPTRPSRAAAERRLAEKRRRGQRKAGRRRPDLDD